MSRIYLSAIAAISCAIFTFAAASAQAECSSADREVLRNFRFESANRGGHCEPESLERKALDAFQFIKNLHWQNSRDEFIQNLIDTTPYKFFGDRITKVIFDQPGSGSLCDNGKTVAYNVVGKLEMHICTYAKGFSTFYIAEVLMHEARHSDGNGFLHYDCQTGVKLEGGGACDDAYETGGAYAVSAEFAVRVSRDASQSEDIRKEARAEAFNHFLTRFVTKPLDMKRGVFLQDDQGRIHFFDGKALLTTPLNTSRREQILAVKNSRLLVVDPKYPLAADLNYSGQMFVAMDGLSKFYRESLTAPERARVLDFYYGSAYQCILLSDSLRCLDDKGVEIKNLELSTIRPRGFLDVAQGSNSKTVNVVDESGSYFQLPSSVDEMRTLKESDLRGRPSALVNFAFIGQNEVSLNRNGDVNLFYTREKQWVSPLPGKKFVKLLGTVWWSKKFDAL